MKIPRPLVILFFAAGCTAAFAQPDGGGSADGVGSDARFRLPTSVAVDDSGNVFVSDSGNHTIRKITSDGVVTTLAGRAGASGNANGNGSEARFNTPTGVAVDGSGTVFVADSGNARIRRISASGVVTTHANLIGTGVAVDRGGNVFVAGYSNQTIQVISPGGVVTTLAGSPGASGSTDGTGSAARFNFPAAVALDSSGNVYVADWNNYTIRKIVQGGVVTTLAGLAGSSGVVDGIGSAARFSNPSGVAVDASGNVFVAGYGSPIIRRTTPEGDVSTFAGTPNSIGGADGTGSAARFYYPQGVAVDRAGNVYVADRLNHSIRKITADGVVTTLAGLSDYIEGNAGVTVASVPAYTFTTLAGSAALGSADGPGDVARFFYPDGIAFDRSGNLFVADSNNHTIRRIAPNGVVSTLAGSVGNTGSNDGTGEAARFFFPRTVAVDGSGNVFVADRYNHTIRKITAGGVVTTLAGAAGRSGNADGTGSAARFNFPFGVAADVSGNVFVADTDNQLIRKITPDGVVTTVAGLAGQVGGYDGIGSNARFNFPFAVATDRSGNVFVADMDNHTIRKITADGMVTTLAGFAGANDHIDGAGSTARFSFPVALAVNESGSVFVLDDATLRKVTSSGVVSTVVGTDRRPFNYPFGVAVDGAGNIIVADTHNQTIRKVTEDGVITTVAGSTGRGSADGVGVTARFSSPGRVAADGSGNAFVADSGNNTIRKITPDGLVTTVAGVAGSSGSTDGPASTARFYSTNAVAVDKSGNVFAADGSTVRKITPDGIVTTMAGMAERWGSNDGTGSAALFADLVGVAVDDSGNVFVADQFNSNIRKITAGGVVTTLAGLADAAGSADGTGSAARFHAPQDVTVDRGGNVYVADFGNHTIRKITADGIVTTMAGFAGRQGNNDGTGSRARFNHPTGIAVDDSGNVFVAESYSHTLRRISPTGVVTTLGGVKGDIGSRSGTGSAARFNLPFGVAVDKRGNVFVADSGNNTIRKGVPAVFATMARTGPQSQHVQLGAAVAFTVAGEGGSLRFQWKKDGVSIAGATGETFTISRAGAADMGFYSVVVIGSGATVESPIAILTIATGGSSRLSNFSARGFVPDGGDLTAGFVIRGSGNKSVLLRAVGPTLGNFGVPGTLADPRLEVFAAGEPVASNSNDDWGGGAALATVFASVGAFPLVPASKDAVVLSTLAVAGHTARVTSSNPGGSGTVLTEVYDRDSAGAASQLANISTLGAVVAGAPALALGFVIDGSAPKRLLIRAVGPGLAPLGVAGALSDPQLGVLALGQLTVMSNDNWDGDAALASAFVSAGTFMLPFSSKDAAVFVRLPPGGYTVNVSGVADTTGRALVEIYDLDP